MKNKLIPGILSLILVIASMFVVFLNNKGMSQKITAMVFIIVAVILIIISMIKKRPI